MSNVIRTRDLPRYDPAAPCPQCGSSRLHPVLQNPQGFPDRHAFDGETVPAECLDCGFRGAFRPPDPAEPARQDRAIREVVAWLLQDVEAWTYLNCMVQLYRDRHRIETDRQPRKRRARQPGQSEVCPACLHPVAEPYRCRCCTLGCTCTGVRADPEP